MSLSDIRTLVHNLLVALAVIQTVLLAIEKLLGGGLELRLAVRKNTSPLEGDRTESDAVRFGEGSA